MKAAATEIRLILYNSFLAKVFHTHTLLTITYAWILYPATPHLLCRVEPEDKTYRMSMLLGRFDLKDHWASSSGPHPTRELQGRLFACRQF